MGHAIIGTAGHVDHGKTALTLALTGVDTDRLKEEKERGVSIEIGFAPLRLPSGRVAGVVDVPGHERFIRNMVAGASGIDVVLLVIAGDEGVMPQTREHLHILELLGVGNGIIVLTKMDLVDGEWAALVESDVRESLRHTSLASAPLVRASAKTGLGLDELRRAVDDAIDHAAERRSVGAARMCVDRVFTMKGFGTVATGSLERGRIAVGEQLEVQPSGLSSRVRAIQIHGEEAEEALAGQRVALNLPELDRDNLDRGDVVATPGLLKRTSMLDARLRLLPAPEHARRRLANWQRLRLHIGTAEIMVRAVLLDQPELAPGGEALVQLRLERPTAALTGDRFIVRTYSPQHTIGGGEVLEPTPRKHRGARRQDAAKRLAALAEGGAEAAIKEAMRQREGEPFTVDEIAGESGVDGETADETVRAALEAERLVALGAERLVDAASYGRARDRIMSAVDDFHHARPLRVGPDRGELRNAVAAIPAELYRAVIDDLVSAGQLSDPDGQHFCRAGRTPEPTPEQERQLGVIERQADKAALLGVAAGETAEVLGTSEAQTAELLRYLCDTGRLVQVTGRYLLGRHYLAARDSLEKRLADGRTVTVAEFRDAVGTSRKPAVLLLEHFDTIGLTMREGDERRLRVTAGRGEGETSHG